MMSVRPLCLLPVVPLALPDTPGVAHRRSVPKLMQKHYFGTDGIRGRVGVPPITPDFILRLGWAAGTVLSGGRDGSILVGKDTRISGYMFESALESGLSAAGVDVCLLGPMPTPAISYLTRSTRALAGVVISASHNEYTDNGIKFFGPDGSKLSDELELAIEKKLEEPMKQIDSDSLGKATRITDAPRRYQEFCKGLFGGNLDLEGMKLAIDCANGATYHIAPKLFSELGASVEAMGVMPDGRNINSDSGAVAPQNLQQLVIDSKCDVGVAFDGDGDRLIMVDDKGDMLDGDDILYILAWAMQDRINGAVVGTTFSNLGLEDALNKLKLRLHRSAIGDRRVVETMRQHELKLGGESSGHIVHLDYTPTGDGIVSAMHALAIMQATGLSLRELCADLIKYPRHTENVALPVGGSEKLKQQNVRDAVEEVRNALGDTGRVLLHLSATEPVVRVLVEGQDEGKVRQLGADLASYISDAMA